MEKERNQLGWHSWGAAAASAADRDGWRNLLAGLKSPHGPDEDKLVCIHVLVSSPSGSLAFFSTSLPQGKQIQSE